MPTQDEVMQQMSYVREWGGQFVVPIPEVKRIHDFQTDIIEPPNHRRGFFPEPRA